MSLSGMCVALSAALVYDKKTVVLSILGTYFNGIVEADDNADQYGLMPYLSEDGTQNVFVLNVNRFYGPVSYTHLGAFNPPARHGQRSAEPPRRSRK